MISAIHQWSQRWPGSSRSRCTNSSKVSSAELKWSVKALSSTSWTARRSSTSGIPPDSRRTCRNTTPLRSQRSGGGTSEASSAVTGWLICHQVRTFSKPPASSRACWRSSSAKAPVSMLYVEPAGRTDLARLPLGPAEEHVGAALRGARLAGCGRRCGRRASGRPHGRARFPRPRISPSASRTTRFSRVRRPCSDTSTSTSSWEAPAQPRPASSWARSSSVSRATTARSSGSGAAASQPAGRPGSWGKIVGVALEPVVVGDHRR